jgi:hypothetical protein
MIVSTRNEQKKPAGNRCPSMTARRRGSKQADNGTKTIRFGLWKRPSDS